MLAASGVAALAFATACGSSGHPATVSSSPSAPATTQPATPAPAGEALKVTTDAKLGQIVTDSNGFTLYRFDNDTANPPASHCTDSCASLWPAAVAPAGTPTGNGVHGTIGTLTRADGTKQLTLNGWPLYRYSPDSKPGDTHGQGVGGIWWAVTPSGDRAAVSTPMPSPTNTGGGY
jgi:predicted lipoprotein with Yx(FWY)xxD motif